MLQALPRSLDPLPEESLPGFLLRLSHRLGTSPQRLAQITGLSRANNSITARIAFRLRPDIAARFADTARLTRQEVANLCLASLGEHYPPLAHDDPQAATSGLGGWILTRSTRYCPECLAGDGSSIQNAHGGPWRKQWRISVMVACPIHDRLLSLTCPSCRTPAHCRSRDTTQSGGIFPLANLVLHPAECRADTAEPGAAQPAPCQTRLDAGTPTGEPGWRPLRTVHDRILNRLHLSTADPRPRRQQDSEHYFHDLRLLVGLIRASWPAGTGIAPAWINTALIDAHITHLHQQTARQIQAGKRVADLTVHSALPADPATCGHLLGLAEHLVPTNGSPSDGQVELLLTGAQNRPGWAKHLASAEVMCSPQLRDVVAARIRASAPVRRGRDRRLVARPCRFDQRHVPHRLPDRHMQPLLDLTADATLSKRVVYRFAAIKLAQFATGCNLLTAERHLDLPPGLSQNALDRVGRWATAHGQQDALSAALDGLFDAFNADPLIDYHQRRKALNEWVIPREHWLVLTALLRDADAVAHGPMNTDWADRKRLMVSIVLGADISRSDHLISPLLPKQAYLRQRMICQLSVADRALREGQPQPNGAGRHLLAVMGALSGYRDRLTRGIDDGQQAHATAPW